MALWPHSQPKVPAGIDALRARYDALFARFGAAPAAVDFLPPASSGPIAGEWVGAVTPEPVRTILYFHGGGFVAGSPQSHRPLIGRLV